MYLSTLLKAVLPESVALQDSIDAATPDTAKGRQDYLLLLRCSRLKTNGVFFLKTSGEWGSGVKSSRSDPPFVYAACRVAI